MKLRDLLTLQSLGLLGRILFVLTFVHVAIDMAHYWDREVIKLRNFGYPPRFPEFFLIFNIGSQIVSSILVILQMQLLLGWTGLLFSMTSQFVVYRLYSNLTELAGFLSILGGLFLLIADWLAHTGPNASDRTPALPSRTSSANPTSMNFRTYFHFSSLSHGRVYGKWIALFLLLGRLLLVIPFGAILTGHLLRPLLHHGVFSIFFIMAIMVALGYRAKVFAILISVYLVLSNISENTKGWAIASPRRDLFFQILSVVGGLILLVDYGPGDISLDKKSI